MVFGGKGNGRGGKNLEIRIDIYTLKVKTLKVFIAQLSPTLCDPMDCSLPGSSDHGILKARILEWVGIPSSRASSQPRDLTRISCVAGLFFIV